MKIALFTDIHWGAKGNSRQHNADCADYIAWFCSHVTQQGCGAIVFMGDWFENRNSINVQTLNASFKGLQALDDLGLPIYFCVGNHDLYHRANREEYSTFHFVQFKNIRLVNEQLYEDGMMFFPYLFRDEYPLAAAAIKKHSPRYVFGHFEFRDFIITGSDRKMDHGPDHKQFTGPTHIFSGHFHKRQALDNVIYIGNTFPTNYGDAWDDARGAAILDTSNDDVDFLNWEEGPRYRKVRLSDVLAAGTAHFPPKTRVRCMIDIDIGYSEAQAMREELIKELNLREFSLEQDIISRKEALEGDGEIFGDFDLSSLNDAVVGMLSTKITGTASINPERLVQIYNQL
jgi:DNA repair exonuclease SbcCD nuclease subunit